MTSKNQKLTMPWEKNITLQGNREDILKTLKKAAKPGCNKCFGRGYIGFKEDKKTKSRIYIPCKCVDGKIDI